MQYQIVTVENFDCVRGVQELERAVKKALADGWKLQGSVAIATTKAENDTVYVLAQPMTK